MLTAQVGVSGKGGKPIVQSDYFSNIKSETSNFFAVFQYGGPFGKLVFSLVRGFMNGVK
ncbi:hypothetical protein L873DRAFT_1816110 [Choiromyces venosus 120613-1]|uniref:Uncharacterized protein n=1 Tax=Choiromyces venosus 120613-1 TaxID=1336337 RepID=A0A3N4J8H8_9PEZI|nr:hypothetical protein L873DRAFT_1816110 [Choiromyces venosus 120613-1]